MAVEILRIHEDYVSKLTMFTLTERLATPGGAKFSKPKYEVSKRTKCLFEVF